MPRLKLMTLGLALMASLPLRAADAQTPPQSSWYQPTAADVLAVNDLMSWYAEDNFSGNIADLKRLFALKTPGTAWQTPRGAATTAEVIKSINDQAARRAARPDPGGLRVQSLMTPLIVFSGDGKTAKAMWDSFGPNVMGLDDEGSWLWIKYAVDFTREDGQWKIWHLQVYSVFKTPYNESWTQSAKDGSNNRMPPGMKGPPPGANAGPKMWIYDGKTPMPEGKPFIPMPYYSFDPATAYVEK